MEKSGARQGWMRPAGLAPLGSAELPCALGAQESRPAEPPTKSHPYRMATLFPGRQGLLPESVKTLFVHSQDEQGTEESRHQKHQ